MSTLVITRGYPGSGKSTYARQVVADDPKCVRINRDDLRFMLWGKYSGLSFEQEQHVTAIERSAVREALLADKTVVVDDTNLRLRHARAWADLAVEVGSQFRCVDMPETADVCVDRDAQRQAQGGRGVGEDVIRKIAARFPMPWPEVKPSERAARVKPLPYEPNLSLPAAWLVDIDGTLAHHGDRDIYDLSEVGQDAVDPVVADLVNMLSDQGYEIVFLSGRSEIARHDTQAWLDHNTGLDAPLFMRGADDRRPDYLVKADLFDSHVRQAYNVIGVLDDRNQVVQMWRGMGLKVLQVADGNF